MEEIGEVAFYACYNLTLVTLPEGVKKLGPNCFYLAGVIEISLPSTLYSISAGALASRSLKRIVLASGNKNYRLEDGVLYEKASNGALVCYPSLLPYSGTSYPVYTVVDGTESIKSFAFFNAQVGGVHIPESVSSMGDGVFANCKYLTKVWLEWEGSSLNRLQAGATQLSWPDVTRQYTDNEIYIYVPKGTKSAYQSTSQWGAFNVTEYDVPIRDFTIGGETTTRSKLASYASNGTISYSRLDKTLTLNKALIDLSGKEGFRFKKNDETQVYIHGSCQIRCGREALALENGASLLVDGMTNDAELSLTNRLGSNNPSVPVIGVNSRGSVVFSDLKLNVNSARLPAITSDDWLGSVTLYNCNASIEAYSKTDNYPVVYLLDDFPLMECYVQSPAGAYYDTDEGVMKTPTGELLKQKLVIAQGHEDVSDLTIGGRPVTTQSVPFLESGSASYNAETGELTLNNAVIRTDGDGIFAPDGIGIVLKGNNYIQSRGNGLTSIWGDNTITGTGSLSINSSEGYGISIDEMLNVYDLVGTPKLEVYGKLGAIDGRRRWNNYTGEYQYGYLDIEDAELYLRSDGTRPPVHDLGAMYLSGSDFVYDNYWFDDDEHTVVYGYDEKTVTRPVHIVPTSSLVNRDLQIMNVRVNNYNMGNFAPQNLESGTVSVQEWNGVTYIVMTDAMFEEESEPDFEAIWCRGLSEVDIQVQGLCYLPAWHGICLLESKTQGCIASITGYGDDPRLITWGEIYVEGVYNTSRLTIRNMSIQVDKMSYVWSQDDCKLFINNSNLDLWNLEDEEEAIMYDIVPILENCYFSQPGVYYNAAKRRVCHEDGTPVCGHLSIKAGRPGATAISTPVVRPEGRGRLYNLQGQRVGDGYRGLVIDNGRKMLRR